MNPRKASSMAHRKDFFWIYFLTARNEHRENGPLFNEWNITRLFMFNFHSHLSSNSTLLSILLENCTGHFIYMKHARKEIVYFVGKKYEIKYGIYLRIFINIVIFVQNNIYYWFHTFSQSWLHYKLAMCGLIPTQFQSADSLNQIYHMIKVFCGKENLFSII